MRHIGTMTVVLALVACGGGGGGGDEGPTSPNQPPAGSPPPMTANVQMVSQGEDYSDNVIHTFSPSQVTISSGGTVTWANSSGFEHNVTFSTAGSPANIANFTSGTQSRTFSSTGSFSYTCTNHAGMSGSVSVQ